MCQSPDRYFYRKWLFFMDELEGSVDLHAQDSGDSWAQMVKLKMHMGCPPSWAPMLELSGSFPQGYQLCTHTFAISILYAYSLLPFPFPKAPSYFSTNSWASLLRKKGRNLITI